MKVSGEWEERRSKENTQRNRDWSNDNGLLPDSFSL